jgi:hypothetical protein
VPVGRGVPLDPQHEACGGVGYLEDGPASARCPGSHIAAKLREIHPCERNVVLVAPAVMELEPQDG